MAALRCRQDGQLLVFSQTSWRAVGHQEILKTLSSAVQGGHLMVWHGNVVETAGQEIVGQLPGTFPLGLEWGPIGIPN